MELLGKFLKYFAYVTISFCNLNALFEKKPLYPTYIPGVGQNNITFTWIIIVYQIPEIYIAMFILVSYIHSILSFILFGIAQIQILSYKISLLSITDDGINLPETSVLFNPVSRQQLIESRLRINLISCIKFHLEIKRFVSFGKMHFSYLISSLTPFWETLYVKLVR